MLIELRLKMIGNYIILMWRKAKHWKVSFVVNLLGLILGLSLVELLFIQFNTAFQTNEVPWLPAMVLTLIILALITINYANFTTLQLKNRFSESGLRKLLGATPAQITAQHLLESLILVIVAVLLSMVLTELIQPWFNLLFNLNCSLREQSALIQLAIAGFLILFVGVVGAIYPIWRFAKITMKDIIGYLKKTN